MDRSENRHDIPGLQEINMRYLLVWADTEGLDYRIYDTSKEAEEHIPVSCPYLITAIPGNTVYWNSYLVRK